MSLSPGTRLGPYEVTGPLGTGGMGEVYRARDTKLHREVAIKVLPPSFAQEEDRLARFEREARLLASLNHPNIAAIYGLEKWEEVLYLVLELVPGETLGQRLLSGPLPVEVALNIFYQIAQALEAAHQKGIIHRDLKPENIKITPERVVKVLDFGLAKSFAQEQATGLSRSPTASYDGISAGMILGTPGYMSPEQARGQAVDRRTDIWAFGCCLYEALTGRNPFRGATVSDIIAALLSNEPEWSALPRTTPANISRLLRRCLRKDSHQRLHDIADARIEIGEALGLHSLTDTAAMIDYPRKRALQWSAAAFVAGLAVGLSVYLWPLPALQDGHPVRRFATEVPPTQPLALESGVPLALSPDGGRLAYVARRGEQTQIFMRTLDRLELSPIQGTEDGAGPFFSPDGEWVGFLADGKLKKAPVSGGAVITLSEAPSPRGASWGEQNRIVFSPLTTGGLSLISDFGGTPQVLTQVDLEADEKSHRWPEVLPGGQAVVFTAWSGSGFAVEVLSLASGERKKLVEGGMCARYAPSGHLVFARENSLFAVPFDPDRLEVTGPEVSVTESVAVDPLTGAAFFGFDRRGLLAYVPGGTESFTTEGAGKLLLVDRQGGGVSLVETPQRSFGLPRLSPNGRRLAATVEEEDKTDIWVSDLDRGTLTRITFEASNAAAVWSPDGSRVVFSSNRDGAFNLYLESADGSGPAERLTTSHSTQVPTSWSRDGGMLAFTELNAETGFDLWVLPMKSKRQPEPFVRTPFDEVGATFSPDGRWIAYMSNETGEHEIYVAAFPKGGKHQVSTSGGTEPVWSPRGRELFYRQGEWLMAVTLETEPDLVAGKPRPLFEVPYAEAGEAYANFDVTPDGQRFLIVRNEREAAATRLVFVENWFQELRALVPASR